jgi:hypothetical protein
MIRKMWRFPIINRKIQNCIDPDNQSQLGTLLLFLNWLVTTGMNCAPSMKLVSDHAGSFLGALYSADAASIIKA